MLKSRLHEILATAIIFGMMRQALVFSDGQFDLDSIMYFFTVGGDRRLTVFARFFDLLGVLDSA